jgi:hypothetical protein
MAEKVEEQRSWLYETAPKKIVSVNLRALDSDDLRIASPAAIKLGDRIGMYEHAVVHEPERDRKKNQDAALGQIHRMYFDKSVRHAMPLSDRDLEELRWIEDYTKGILEACDKNRKQAGGPVASLASAEDRET